MLRQGLKYHQKSKPNTDIVDTIEMIVILPRKDDDISDIGNIAHSNFQYQKPTANIDNEIPNLVPRQIRKS